MMCCLKIYLCFTIKEEHGKELRVGYELRKMSDFYVIIEFEMAKTFIHYEKAYQYDQFDETL